jgi:hypothetical protein
MLPDAEFAQEAGMQIAENINRYIPRVPEGPDLAEAERIVDEVLLKDRFLPSGKRHELISLVADELVSLRAQGRESEIVRKVQRWIEAAQELRCRRPSE